MSILNAFYPDSLKFNDNYFSCNKSNNAFKGKKIFDSICLFDEVKNIEINNTNIINYTKENFNNNNLNSITFKPVSDKSNLFNDKNTKNIFNLLNNNSSWNICLNLKINSNLNKWRNIFHYGNSNYERSPALWIFPNNPWKLHFRIPTLKNKNDGFDFYIPNEFRNFNQKLNIQISCNKLNDNKIIFNSKINNVNSNNKILNTKLTLLSNKNFYIKDPWYINYNGYNIEYVTFSIIPCPNQISNCDKFKEEIQLLKNQKSITQKNLTDKHNLIQNKYNNLTTQHTNLTSNYTNLNLKHNNLTSQHKNLKNDYSNLQNKYNNYNKIFSINKKYNEKSKKDFLNNISNNNNQMIETFSDIENVIDYNKKMEDKHNLQKDKIKLIKEKEEFLLKTNALLKSSNERNNFKVKIISTLISLIFLLFILSLSTYIYFYRDFKIKK